MDQILQQVSNLITNLVVAGASKAEIQRAVDYSIAVIDARSAYRKKGIAELEEKYSKVTIINHLADGTDVTVAEYNERGEQQ